MGEAAYDAGAQILTEFFHEQISKFLVDDLDAHGRKIIEACLDGATHSDFVELSQP